MTGVAEALRLFFAALLARSERLDIGQIFLSPARALVF
jgi:hypothetical protein